MCMGCKFGLLVALFALLENVGAWLRHLHWLQPENNCNSLIWLCIASDLLSFQSVFENSFHFHLGYGHR